jgi:hypothetical protein
MVKQKWILEQAAQIVDFSHKKQTKNAQKQAFLNKKRAKTSKISVKMSILQVLDFDILLEYLNAPSFSTIQTHLTKNILVGKACIYYRITMRAFFSLQNITSNL